jgi:hypothetical protein
VHSPRRSWSHRFIVDFGKAELSYSHRADSNSGRAAENRRVGLEPIY